MERMDFSYDISDERLLAYSQLPILDRLRWLDEVRQFTLMVRQAPLVDSVWPKSKTNICINVLECVLRNEDSDAIRIC